MYIYLYERVTEAFTITDNADIEKHNSKEYI